MRKAAFLTAVLLLSTVWVVAQTAGTGQTGTATQPPSPTGSMPQTSGTMQNPQSQTGTPVQMPATPNAQSAPQTGAAPQPGGSASSSTAAPTGPQTTIEGCLSGTPGQYSLTTKSGQVYPLGGDDSLIGNHVGQQVKITGAETSGSAAGTTGAAGTPGGTATASTPAGAPGGGTPYGSTGTTGSQPGATTQMQAGTTPGQSSTTPGQTGASPGSTANNPAGAGQTAAGSPSLAGGPKFQVSNLTQVSPFCKMTEPH